jgi:hypothetical protein
MSDTQKTRQLVEHLHKMIAAMVENSARSEAMISAYIAVKDPTDEATKEYMEDMAFMQQNFDIAKAEIISKLDRIKSPWKAPFAASVAKPPSPPPPPSRGADYMSRTDKYAFEDIARRRGEDDDHPPRPRKRQARQTADQTEDE